MLDSYEQLVVLRYLINILTSGRITAPALKDLCSVLERATPSLGLNQEQYEDAHAQMEAFYDAARERLRARGEFKPTLQSMSSMLKNRCQELKSASPGPIAENVRVLARELELDETEEAFFGLVLRHRLHDPFSDLLNNLTREHMSALEACAISLGVERRQLAEKIRTNGHLLSSGVIVQATRNGRDLDDHFDIPSTISTAMQKSMASLEDFRKYILGEAARAELDWNDFAHLGKDRDRLAAFIREAVKKRLKGINILLWGPPGTGKTEFCKTLATHLGLNLYQLAEADDEGAEPNRKERIGAFQLAQNLLRYRSDNLLLFDEMDDLFENKGLAMLFGAKFSAGSKVFINRLFENNPVPTLWTINDVAQLDETIIRRMSLAVEIKVPSAPSRGRVWRRLLDKHEVTLPEDELKKLARLDIAPAVVNNAVQFAKHAGGSLEDFKFATRGIIRAIRGANPLPTEPEKNPYLPELINATPDIGGMTEKLVKVREKRFSLCLYGPPGTGKSAYVRHLAEKLGMPVLVKRASDLLSKWVGGSEENIARAFEEAVEKECFLVFDEADSLLGDRRAAHASWEVSQVNEMLTWMESHPLPFACTTNLRERLDRASLRRFTFKCHFSYLRQEQVDRAWRQFFGTDGTPEAVRRLRCLTPGDLAVVRKKARLLGCQEDASQLAEMIRLEVEAKDEQTAGPIGFNMA